MNTLVSASCCDMIECSKIFLLSVLCFIESHPVFIETAAAVITSSLIAKKYLREKRAEAFSGLYIRLYMQLKSFMELLSSHDRINCNDNTRGTIFCLRYDDDTWRKEFPSFPGIDKSELETYKKCAEQLNETILKTEKNIYPKNASKRKWYNYQRIIIEFCNFITYDDQHKCTNNVAKEYYIGKCVELVTAVDYICSKIAKTKYY